MDLPAALQYPLLARQPQRKRRRLLSKGTQKVLGLSIKASLMTAQRFLDLLVLWCIACEDAEDRLGPEWWLLVLGALVSTVLSAVTMSRQRCAVLQNRPYGWVWASIVASSQLAALAEMIDKLGDGLLWGVLDTASTYLLAGSNGPAGAVPDMKGNRYGENLMRGLRKLCLVSLPTLLLTTSVHLLRLWQVILQDKPCGSSCQTEVAALFISLFCLAMAYADVVLYIWVDDAFVKRHKKLVQFHYFVELLSRQPIILLVHVVMRHKHSFASPLLILWVCDVLADVMLLLVPTLRAWFRGRLSCRHGLSQVSTAVIVAQLLFCVNITFFDPRNAFLVLNSGFYIVKTVEVIVMWKLVDVELSDAHFFQTFSQAQLLVTVVNAALVWVVVPWAHRAMEDKISRGSQEPRGNSQSSFDPLVVAAARRRFRRSRLSSFGPELPSRDRARSLELGTIRASPAEGARINASLVGEDKGMRLELLGDIMEALCLLSQTQSMRNRPVLSRAMVVNMLWSLVLPLQGDYEEDGSGGRIRLTMLDPEKGAVLVEHLPCAETPEATGCTGASQQTIALAFQGTALQVVREGEGRVLATFDGQRIRVGDRRRSVWTRCGGVAADGEGAQEVLRMVLMQLLLALRWEPTFVGLGPRGVSGDEGPSVTIDASQRPLLCFLIRYALVSRNLILISELYWCLWCLSHDVQDNMSEAYKKARWVLVKALQGTVEFWDGDLGVCLSSRADDSEGSREDELFRCNALQLLAQHGSMWRQTVMVAHMGTCITGDAAERTRVVQKKLMQWHDDEHSQDEDAALDLLLDREDPFLSDVRGDLQNRAPVNLVEPGRSSAFVSLPVEPGVRFLGLNIAGCEILPSKATPMVLSCLVEMGSRGGVGHTGTLMPGAQRQSSGSSSSQQGSQLSSVVDASSSVAASPSSSPQAFAETLSDDLNAAAVQKYMVKVGDDLRQDQLVLQLFALMELVWQERLPPTEHEMLRLAPYRVLAMTPNAGYVKFVPGAVSLSAALYHSRGDLTAWFDANRPRSIPLAEVLNNLCGSVAAYCVATYCLGIGDRHLDNLQITPEGRFFHVDFSFIFGDDPKPFAPHLRLPRPVASALLAAETNGGQLRTLLDKCFLLAGRAYVALRRSMPLWVSLLHVTGEAGGAGCQRLRAQKEAAVVMVRDRLRADLGAGEEEAAATEFLRVLQESKEALYPMLTDKVHQLAIFWK